MTFTDQADEVGRTRPGAISFVSVPEAIAGQAARSPGCPAVVSSQGVMTYGQLLDRASALADELAAAGVRSEATVASCLPRSAAIAVSVLGTWLAHGCYVPIDAGGPAQRMRHMLRDCRTTVMVAAAGVGQAPLEAVRRRIELDGTGQVQGGHGAAWPRLPRPTAPHDLAYLMYTSGSSGRPKGVMVEHGSLAAMASGHEQALYAGPAALVRRVALNTVATADSFFSDFVHLAQGRTLFLLQEETRRDPERLAQYIRDHDIEVLDATPTQVRNLIRAGRAADLESLRILILGGEPVDAELWNRLRLLAGVRAYNLYGPTECTVDVTAAAVSAHDAPVLGTELPGCQVWVTDEAGQPLPDGHAGELCIAGPHLARGYLHPGPADAARFTEILPPGGTAPVRAYRSGDRGRRNGAGQLEFLGRADSQVSIAGFRVELGEVEAGVRSCAGVLDTAVGLRGAWPSASLTAWVVLAPDSGPEQVRAELAAVLPRQMMPSLIVVPAIPVGPSGKADLDKLRGQAGGPAGPGGTEDRVADIIRRIWLDVLDGVSARDSDDFFDIGGDSASATRAVVAAREALSAEIPIRMIFDHPQFGAFCAQIARLVHCGTGSEISSA